MDIINLKAFLVMNLNRELVFKKKKNYFAMKSLFKIHNKLNKYPGKAKNNKIFNKKQS